MLAILLNGFYVSPQNYWIDMHAGHKFETVDYGLYLFLNDKELVSKSTNTLNFSFDVFSTRKDFIDNYNVLDKNTLEIVFNPNGMFPVKKYFTIHSPKILLDNNLREYHFKYVVGIKHDELLLSEAINKSENIWAASNPMDITILFKDIKDVPNINNASEIYKYFQNPQKYVDLTGFGKEVKTLIDNGYTYNSQTKMFLK